MATPPRVAWRGRQDVQRVGRGRWKFNAQEVTCTLRYEGPYDSCLSNVPLIGQTIAGYTGYGVKVADADVDEGPGSKGLMTIFLRNPYSLAVVSNPAFQQVGDAVTTLHWQPFKRKIEAHPLCGTSNLPPGTGVSTDGHIPQANYTSVSGGWDYDDYLSLIKGGYTEYDAPQPVLGLTTFSYSRPQGVGSNNYQLDVPDATVLPVPAGGWKWLREGDDLQRQEKLWRLQKTWTGFLPGPDRNSAFELLYETT